MTDAERKSYDSTVDHMRRVFALISKFAEELLVRGMEHDRSKLSDDEFTLFAEYTPKLRAVTYGSDEYARFLDGLKPALDHHYAVSRHHPEHFPDGMRGMTLVDVVEMFLDWYAASERHADGDPMRSVEINQKRFGFSDDLRRIFENTAADLAAKKERT